MIGRLRRLWALQVFRRRVGLVPRWQPRRRGRWGLLSAGVLAAGVAWPCGRMAAAALATALRGQPVRCRLLGEDRFGRALGRCWAGGDEINAWLVREGWAVAYTRYSWRYLPQQALAWWEGRGIWQGGFEAPEDWRRANQR